ncbi:MAG: PD40 domain-containing protein [Actinobacteria bacterium]|nr:PD40 domain-containing protein [Actinomycetota bacterium]
MRETERERENAEEERVTMNRTAFRETADVDRSRVDPAAPRDPRLGKRLARSIVLTFVVIAGVTGGTVALYRVFRPDAAPRVPSSPALAGNGRIAFQVSRGSEFSIAAIDPAGGNHDPMFSGEVSDRDVAWSPDGERIAFWRSSVTDEGVDWGIYVSAPDGSGLTRIRSATGPRQNPYAIEWSPDGRIGFVLLEWPEGPVSDGDRVYRLFVMNPDGSGLEEIPTESQLLHFSWSPDGSRIAYTRQDPRFGYDIYVIDSDGTNATRLTDDGRSIHPDWSADGSRIAFSSFEGSDEASRDIYVMDADGSNRRRMTTTAATEFAPEWSPDGTMIAFGRLEGGTGCSIVVVAVDGSSERMLIDRQTAGGCVGSPAWQPLP